VLIAQFKHPHLVPRITRLLSSDPFEELAEFKQMNLAEATAALATFYLSRQGKVQVKV
jgi:hypothetical protein